MTEKTFTKVENELIEALGKTNFKLNGTQFRIIQVVLRYTNGFSREAHSISESFLSNATGINKRQIRRELVSLIESNIIRVTKEPTFSSSREISLNENYLEWGANELINIQMAKKSTGDELDHSTGDELDHSTGDELDPQERNILKKNIKKEYTCSFERFWSTYPKKTAKATAQKAWNKIKPDDNLVSVILKALEQQKNSAQWQKDNGQFIPYPVTYLNQRRWEDESEIVIQSENDIPNDIITVEMLRERGISLPEPNVIEGFEEF
jgi:phage replication O-like protein O